MPDEFNLDKIFSLCCRLFQLHRSSWINSLYRKWRRSESCSNEIPYNHRHLIAFCWSIHTCSLCSRFFFSPYEDLVTTSDRPVEFMNSGKLAGSTPPQYPASGMSPAPWIWHPWGPSGEPGCSAACLHCPSQGGRQSPPGRACQTAQHFPSEDFCSAPQL